MILNGLAVELDQSTRVRQAAQAVESARADGLPVSVEEEAALPPGQRRLAIDAPTVSQIPSRKLPMTARSSTRSSSISLERRSEWPPEVLGY